MNAPHDKSDYTLAVVLSVPTSGAILGGQSTAQLTIHDPSPDTSPPELNNLTFLGSGKQITGLSLGFSEAIGPDTAQDPH